MSLPKSTTAGHSALFSFPFWLMVDTTNPPTIKEISLNRVRTRIYPPFRSGPANYIPMPAISLNAIPFSSDLKVNFPQNSFLKTMSVIPKLGLDQAQKAGLVSFWDVDWTERPQAFPMDSVRIDVLESNVDQAEQLAITTMSQLIQLLRCRSRQWWIEKTVDSCLIRGSFPIHENGAPIGESPLIRGKGRTVSGDELAIDEHLWLLAIDDLENNVVVPMYDLLVLDSRYFAAIPDIRRSILDAATACEQARDFHFERLWNKKSKDSPFKLSRVLKGDSLPLHISVDLMRLANHSYQNAYPEQFLVVEDLWNARGSVAHGRLCHYFRDNRRHDVDDKKATQFSQAVEHCSRWLESL